MKSNPNTVVELTKEAKFSIIHSNRVKNHACGLSQNIHVVTYVFVASDILYFFPKIKSVKVVLGNKDQMKEQQSESRFH